jgi:hypothetical protein
MSVLEKIDTFLNEEEISEATVEFYTHAQGKPSDTLQVKDVPALLRAVGMGAKKIALGSEGDRKALNKALKLGKYIYASFDPFHQDVSGIHELLWHTNKKKFVKAFGDSAMEV